jgi:uncharacterized membrane protein
MLQQFKAAARPARRVGIILAATVSVVAAGHASPADAKPHREPTSYCAYELGANLVVEAINNRNQIAGTAVLGDLAQAFVWDWNRGVRLLGVLPEAAISIGNDINDRGAVVGNSGGGGILQQAFIWDEQNGMRRVVALGGESSSALRINEAGDIMGLSSTTAEDGEHLYFRDHNGDVVDLGDGIPFGLNDFAQVGFSRQSQQPPPDSDVFIWHWKTGEQQLGGFPEHRLILPSAINNRMHIVGSVLGADGQAHAMRWTSRKGMELLGPADEPGFSHATDVNEWGTVVGYMDLGFPIHPFIWRKKTGRRDLMTLLHPTSPTTPQAETIEARAVNDLGWIAINAHDRVGTNPRAYVLTPKFRNDDSPCAAPPAASD